MGPSLFRWSHVQFVSRLLLTLAISHCLVTHALAEDDDPVTIALKGTKVNDLPTETIMVVDNPVEAAKAFAGKGNRHLVKPKSVIGPHSMQLYSFTGPNSEELYILGGVGLRPNKQDQFSAGDVIYRFIFADDAAKDDFCKQHALDVKDQRKNFRNVYSSSKGYFVQVLIEGDIFFCPMHPHMRQGTKGKCPICNMPYSKMTGLR